MTETAFTKEQFIAAVKEVAQERGSYYTYEQSNCTYRGPEDPQTPLAREEGEKYDYRERCLFGEALIGKLKVDPDLIKEGTRIHKVLDDLGFSAIEYDQLHVHSRTVQERQDNGHSYGSIFRDTIFAE